MKLDTYKDSVNYTCQVLKVTALRNHPNADRLKIATLQGNNVICGLDTQVGDVVLYFPTESQLGERFAEANDLIRRKDADGKPAGGMFENHRRVRCVKIRSEYSEGFICPINYLDNVGINSSRLSLESQFNSIDGVEICKKYIPKQRGNPSVAKTGKKPKRCESKLIDGQFRLAYDTSKLRQNLHAFAEDSLIAISEKMHGMNCALGKVLCKKKLSRVEKTLKFFGANVVDTEYSDVYSSRAVIKNKDLNPNPGFYNFDLWSVCYEKYKEFLEPNVILYGELVGQLPTGRWIQGGYRYGTKDNEWDFYVYRITFTTIAGKVYDFNWQQIKNYCDKYGIKHVPELFYGRVSEFFSFAEKLNRDVGYIQDDDTFESKFLTTMSNTYLEKDLPEGVPFEGVCVRNESKDFIAYKLKARNFLKLETETLDKDEITLEDEDSMQEAESKSENLLELLDMEEAEWEKENAE